MAKLTEREDGSWGGPFVQFGLALHYQLAQGNNHVANLYQRCKHIDHDIWSLGALVHRLDWMSRQDMEFERWFYYASLDIEHFHTEFRAAMDYLAGIIYRGEGKRRDSYRRLIQWLPKEEGHQEFVGKRLASIALESADWFWKMRTVRDEIMHRGAQALLFESPKMLLFQVLDTHGRYLIDNPAIMYNKNVAYFARYAALSFARLLVLLDTIAEEVSSSLDIDLNINGGFTSSGFSVLVPWMVELLSVYEEQI